MESATGETAGPPDIDPRRGFGGIFTGSGDGWLWCSRRLTERNEKACQTSN
jgi:hypothetical protein